MFTGYRVTSTYLLIIDAQNPGFNLIWVETTCQCRSHPFIAIPAPYGVYWSNHFDLNSGHPTGAGSRLSTVAVGWSPEWRPRRRLTNPAPGYAPKCSSHTPSHTPITSSVSKWRLSSFAHVQAATWWPGQSHTPRRRLTSGHSHIPKRQVSYFTLVQTPPWRWDPNHTHHWHCDTSGWCTPWWWVPVSGQWQLWQGKLTPQVHLLTDNLWMVSCWGCGQFIHFSMQYYDNNIQCNYTVELRIELKSC